MKRIMIAALAVLMAACQPMPASDGPTEIAAIVPAGQTVIGPSVAGSEDAAACARAGGKMLPQGRMQSVRCVITYADAGRASDLGRRQMQLRTELEEAEAELLALYASEAA